MEDTVPLLLFPIVIGDKAAHDFAAYLASEYRISTKKTTILDQKYEIPVLDRLLKHKRKVNKLWEDTRDPACKAAINCH
jgi:hypothetical protein